MRSIKHVLVAVIVLLASAGMAFATGQTESSATGPIKIGVAGAHTGDLASYGIPSMRAVELYAEKINAAGGIDGRQIELVIEDDACDVDQAANVATKLLGSQVVAVIGHICSGATEAALPLYNDSGVLVISSSATNPPLTQSGKYPNFFRTIAPDDAQANTQVRFAVDVLGLKKFAVIHDKDTYGQGLAELAKDMLEAESGVEVALFEGITANALDYSAIVNKIAASDAEAVIYGGYHPEASKLVTQMKNANLDIAFISDDGVKDNTFIQVAKDYAEGVYATGPMDSGDNPLVTEAITAHQQKYGEEPGAFFLEAYAAAIVLFNAIDVAGSTDFDKIKAALQSENVDTTVGNITFDEKGDSVGIGFAMFQVQNGVYVTAK
jgi:branched-chain amino acid transport system substrate-binding protein